MYNQGYDENDPRQPQLFEDTSGQGFQYQQQQGLTALAATDINSNTMHCLLLTG